MRTTYWVIGLVALFVACFMPYSPVIAQAVSSSTTVWETFTNSTTVTVPTTSYSLTTTTQTTLTVLTHTNTSTIVSVTTVPAFTISTTTSILVSTSTTIVTTLVPQFKQQWLTSDQLTIVSLLELLPLLAISVYLIRKSYKKTNGNSARIDPKKMKPK